nr:hypothetical protein [Tanacetum cinerariifolium]
LGARYLQVVAGDAFVQRQGFDFPQRVGVEAGRVHHQRRHPPGRSRLVGGAALVAAIAGLQQRLDRQLVGRDRCEQQRQVRIHAREGAPVAVQQRVRIGVEQACIAARKGKELGQGAAKAGALDDRAHRCADARHFLQAERMDLGRRQRRRGGIFHQQRIPGRAAGQAGR